MKAPKFYSYLPGTGEYAGEGVCDESPLEPGEFIVPGCATLTKPPKVKKGYVALHRDDGWVVLQDHRGEVRFLDGKLVEIKDIGDPAQWGLPPMVVHEAHYVLPADRIGEDAVIRMAVNDTWLEFEDQPGSLARRVLAAWEAQGGVIQPVESPDLAPHVEEEPIDLLGRFASIEERLDTFAKAAVEGGSPVPQEKSS